MGDQIRLLTRVHDEELALQFQFERLDCLVALRVVAREADADLLTDVVNVLLESNFGSRAG